MDLNPWEDSDIQYLEDDPNEMYPIFLEACSQDGAILIGSNGRVMGSNGYLEPPEESKEKAETFQGMGAKHIAASRISTTEEVVYAKALSATTGNITTFVDGRRHKVEEREEFSDKWYDTEK